jgi:hypothetical protein
LSGFEVLPLHAPLNAYDVLIQNLEKVFYIEQTRALYKLSQRTKAIQQKLLVSKIGSEEDLHLSIDLIINERGQRFIFHFASRYIMAALINEGG